MFLPNDYDPDTIWKKWSAPYKHADFDTHAYYLEFMREQSDSLKVKVNIKEKKLNNLDKSLVTKVSLLKLTLKNIEAEKNQIDSYPEYSVVCSSWISVKSYYLVFNLFIILEYLIRADSSYLNPSHTAVHNCLKDLIESNILVLNNQYFRKVISTREALDWNAPLYSNVKPNIATSVRSKQVLKILARYSKEKYKIDNKNSRLIGTNKLSFEKKTVNLCEFFYHYRIKANYRDMEFMDKGVQLEKFINFYNDYYELTINFHSAFCEAINFVAMRRVNRQLI